jgi:hypothetical protein
MGVRLRLLLGVFLIGLLVASSSVSVADEAAQATTCTALAQSMNTALENNCSDAGTNAICYGASLSEVMMIPGETGDLDFDEPGDTAALTNLALLTSQRIDDLLTNWGASVLNPNADLPVGLPGRSMVWVLLGGVEIENDVEVVEALVLPDVTLPITVSDTVSLFAAPAASSTVVGQVAAGTTLLADGADASGGWARVYFEYDGDYGIVPSAWLNIESSGIDTSVLPLITEESRTPFQEFFLRTDQNPDVCQSELPTDTLVIQSPGTIESNIVVNGETIRIIGTVGLRIIGNSGFLQVVALDGIAILNPDSADPIVVPPGHSSEICLGQAQNLGTDRQENDQLRGNCNWNLPRLLQQNELRLLEVLENLPDDVLDDGIVLPDVSCASGIGGAVCQVGDIPQDIDALIDQMCDAGDIPPDICAVLGYVAG